MGPGHEQGPPPGPSKLNSSARGGQIGRVPQGTPRAAEAMDLGRASGRSRRLRLLRKDVIPPHVPLLLPSYVFPPVTSHTIDGCLPRGLDDRLPVQLAPMV